MLKLVLPGTGALQPLPGRALASACISCDGRNLLIDCGEGTQAAARASGISLVKIDVIALTHYHGDHIFGLPGLLQSMGIAQRRDKLVIIGPEGLEEALAPIMRLCGGLPFDTELMLLPSEGIALHTLFSAWPEEIYLQSFCTRHSVPSQGYRIDYLRPGLFLPEKAIALGIPKPLWKLLQHGSSVEVEGRTILSGQVLGPSRKGIRIVYTGDTAYYPEMAEEVKRADLLICDGTYGDTEQRDLALQRGHMCFAQAAQAAREAEAGELWLTHYSPMVSDPLTYLANAQALFVNTQCGFDGIKKTFAFEERVALL